MLGRNEYGSGKPVAYLCLQVFFNCFLSSGGLLSLGERQLAAVGNCPPPGGRGYLPQLAAGETSEASWGSTGKAEFYFVLEKHL